MNEFDDISCSFTFLSYMDNMGHAGNRCTYILYALFGVKGCYLEPKYYKVSRAFPMTRGG